MKTLLIFFFSGLIIIGNAQATIIHVPTDQPTIQAGVDVATSGDTIMVGPGVYYETITLIPSICLIGAGADSSKIDGEHMGTVITAADSDRIEGFTIRNGYNGIYLNSTFAVILKNAISGNDGFGVVCESTPAVIVNNTIYNNGQGSYSGGIACYRSDEHVICNNIIYDNSAYGIYCYDASPDTIANNVLYSSGSGFGLYNGRFGIGCNNNSSPIIENNIVVSFYENAIFLQSGSSPDVRYNDFYNNGGGNPPGVGNIFVDPLFEDESHFDFHLQGNSPCVDAGNPDTAYNDLDSTRNDMGVFGGPNASSQMYVDGAPLVPRGVTAIGGNGAVILLWDPDEISGNKEDFAFFKIYRNSPQPSETLTTSTEYVDSGLTNGITYYYAIAAVDTLGNESDLSREVSATPNESAINTYIVDAAGGGDFLTIQEAISAASPGDTIKVMEGTYYENLILDYGINLIGVNPNTTIVNGGGNGSTIVGASHCLVMGFTITNGNYTKGGGIRCKGNSMKIINNRITGNLATYFGGGGIDTGEDGGPHIIRYNSIDNNSSNGPSGIWGGGISCFDASDIVNNTISNNYCSYVGGGIAIHSMGKPSPIIKNNIISNNIADYGGGIMNEACPQISFNDVWDNVGGDYYGCSAGQSDLSLDPLFVDTACGDFHLQEDSPCIDAGDPDSDGDGITWENDPDDQDPDGTRMDMGAYYYDQAAHPGSPVIKSIADVPNDQGRQVRISWSASEYDVPGDTVTITGYSLWRRIDSLSIGPDREQRLATEIPSRLSYPPGDWEYVLTIPARCEEVYACIAPTLCDSAFDGVCWSVFFVSAMTPDPLVYFDSPPDSGYSVDNLAPGKPEGLKAEEGDQLVDLFWEPNPEPDVAYYAIYRDTDSNFTTFDTIDYAIDTTYRDATVHNYVTYYYKISAFDFSGNESEHSDKVRATPPVGIPYENQASTLPDAFALCQNYPNPFNSITEIRYALPKDSKVILVIYNVVGQKVATLMDREEKAGYKTLSWDAGSLSSGIYFYRLQAGDFVETKRMILLK